jgi:hypothetical protein
MDMPKDFFTIQSMLTLSGATGATFVVSNAIQAAFNFNPKWLALVIAEVIVLTGVFLTNSASLVDYMIGVINGCLVYTSAAGATGVLGGGAPTGVARGTAGAAPPTPKQARQFLTSWF